MKRTLKREWKACEIVEKEAMFHWTILWKVEIVKGKGINEGIIYVICLFVFLFLYSFSFIKSKTLQRKGNYKKKQWNILFLVF